MKRKIVVHAELAKRLKFKPIRMHVANYRQTLDALNFVHPSYDREVIAMGNQVSVFLRKGKKLVALQPGFIDMPFGDATEVHIIPKMEGADPFTIGAAIVSAVGGVGFAAAVGATGVLIANFVVGALVSYAMSALAGAIVNSLSPKPGDAATRDRKDSHRLGSTVTVTEEGAVVPVVLGLAMTPGVLIDFGSYAEEIPLDD